MRPTMTSATSDAIAAAFRVRINSSRKSVRLKRSYSERDIEKVLGRNLLRVIEQVEQAARAFY
jgi:hypothetical protein